MSQNEIIVNEHPLVSITSATTGQMWTVHEFGHAFNVATKQTGGFWGQGYIDLAQQGVWVRKDRIASKTTPKSYSNNDTYVRTEYGYLPGINTKVTGSYRQNSVNTVSEDFADMYMNWVFDSFANNAAGEARLEFGILKK